MHPRSFLAVSLSLLTLTACQLEDSSSTAPASEPLFTTTASCDTLWNIWRTVNECGVEAKRAQMQSNYEESWQAEHDIWNNWGIQSDTVTGYAYEFDEGLLALPAEWVQPSSENAGVYPEDNDVDADGPQIWELDEGGSGFGSQSGPWTTAWTAGACAVATNNAVNAYDSFVEAYSLHLSNPTPETVQHAANTARTSRSASAWAAAACAVAVLSLASPI